MTAGRSPPPKRKAPATRKTPAKRKAPAKRAGSTSASIAIKRVYEPASAADGVRILVDRLWPRGVSKVSLQGAAWPRELAPSNALRQWYGHDPQRATEFRRRYRGELEAHRDELAALRATIKGRTATLLTATRELALSHAAVLRDVLAEKPEKQ
jgi:uncharacterized protein YeaO (DUF488 family)